MSNLTKINFSTAFVENLLITVVQKTAELMNKGLEQIAQFLSSNFICFVVKRDITNNHARKLHD